MKLSGEAVLLRVFVSETDKVDGKCLYEQIVLRARELNIAGATVFRGIMGYGASSRLHTAKILRLSDDLPLVIEIVDTQEKLDPLLPFLDAAVETGMVTTETVHVVHYRPGAQPEEGA
jgi:uncharacterized protein